MPKWASNYATTGVDPVQILASQKLLTKHPGGAVIKAGVQWVRPGHFLRQITAAGVSQYSYTHSKVSKVLASPAPTTTTFAVGNPHPFVAGDAITIAAANGTVLSVDYPRSGAYPQALFGGTGSGVITLTAALGAAPTAGVRVFSQTAAQNQVDVVSLNEADFDPTSDASVEVATSGWFIQSVLENMYHTDDIQGLNAAAATGAGMRLFAARLAYRWS
jgi:hypothetical protein